MYVTKDRWWHINFAISRMQLYEFKISINSIHEFTISTWWIHDFNFTNSRFQLHESNFINSRFQLHNFNFTNSTSWIHDFNFMNSRLTTNNSIWKQIRVSELELRAALVLSTFFQLVKYVYRKNSAGLTFR